MDSKRKSGILLHISSLPSRFGIGDLGHCADQFVDFLHSAGQSCWQVLPINPTDAINEHSPYCSSSAFAGNVLFISPERLVDDGLLDQNDLKTEVSFSDDTVDFDSVVPYKLRLCETAYDHFVAKKEVWKKHDIPFREFCNINTYWLDDYALFVTIKNKQGGIIWTAWPAPYRVREAEALDEFAGAHNEEINKVKFLQYCFFMQWGRLKDYCLKKQVQLIGDMAIYMTFDSADVWAHPQNYKLDDHLKPTFVAGVPPDYFSPTGQRWGYPVYNWEVMQQTKYDWWIERFKFNFQLYDIVRVDHFRGLVQCWEIPSSEATAVNGKWMDVPTEDFIRTLQQMFSRPLGIIAEDLGYITDDVRDIMRQFNIPGMKVLLFAFNENLEDHPYLPHNFSERCVVYTGTHDNNTVLGWYEEEATEKEKDNLRQYLQRDVTENTICDDLMRLAYESAAEYAILPLQDILGLNGDSRMNKPATTNGNWRWRASSDMLNSELIQKLAKMTEAVGRG